MALAYVSRLYGNPEKTSLAMPFHISCLIDNFTD
jgi:hypothetical protein